MAQFLLFAHDGFTHVLLELFVFPLAICQAAGKLINFSFFVSESVLVKLKLVLRALELALQTLNIGIQLLPLFPHILKIHFDLCQQFVLISFLLQQVLILLSEYVFVLFRDRMLIFLLLKQIFLLGYLLLVLFDVVKELVFLLPEQSLLGLFLDHHCIFRAQFFFVILLNLKHVFVYVRLQGLLGLLVFFVEFEQLVIESVNLVLQLLVDLRVSHELQIPIDLALSTLLAGALVG